MGETELQPELRRQPSQESFGKGHCHLFVGLQRWFKPLECSFPGLALSSVYPGHPFSLTISKNLFNPFGAFSFKRGVGAVLEKLVEKTVMTLALLLDFLYESPQFSPHRGEKITWCWQEACSTQVLWPRRLSLLDLIRGLFRRTPPFGRECHQRLLVQPFCSEVTLSHENSSLTPTCISPVLRSPSIAPWGQGNIGERQHWAHGAEKSLSISQQGAASQT